MRLIVVVCLILLAGCSPQKKLQRLIKKHPELVRDTTIQDIDTFIINVPKVSNDTVINLHSVTHDTLILEKERLRIQTYYNHHTDSLYIYGECEEIIDTVTRTEQIKVPYVVNNEDKFPWKWLILIISGSVIYHFYQKKNQ